MFCKVLQRRLMSGYTDINMLSSCTENDSSLDYINKYIYHINDLYVVYLPQKLYRNFKV